VRPVPVGGGLQVEEGGRRQQVAEPVDRRLHTGHGVEHVAGVFVSLHAGRLPF
jgi:hypothetical protein